MSKDRSLPATGARPASTSELIRQDKERRLGDLEQELVAAAEGPKIEVPLAEIRRKGLITALRDRTRRR